MSSYSSSVEELKNQIKTLSYSNNQKQDKNAKELSDKVSQLTAANSDLQRRFNDLVSKINEKDQEITYFKD